MGKVDKCRVPLTDNEIIQGSLGKEGIKGMEEDFWVAGEVNQTKT